MSVYNIYINLNKYNVHNSTNADVWTALLTAAINAADGDFALRLGTSSNKLQISSFGVWITGGGLLPPIG